MSEVHNKDLQSLQALRAVAAILVVLFHMNVYTIPFVLGADALWSGLNMGYSGVEIFFVLSGFIMYYVHRKDIGKKGVVFDYIWKRITRIFPLFWIVILAIAAFKIISTQTDFTLLGIASAVLLLLSTSPLMKQC